MPHTNHAQHTSSSGDDLGSTDEVKVFKDEGDRDDEKNSSENLLEEKSSLIDLTESEEKSSKLLSRAVQSPVFSKIESHPSAFNMGYLVSPYQYSNGSAGGLPVTMTNKIGLPCFFNHNGDHLTTPPPAHCGIPPYQLDAKSMSLPRPAIYPFSSTQYPYPMINPDLSQVATWHTPSVYSTASGFRSPYTTSLPINSSLPGDFSFRFSPNMLPSVHTSQHHMLSTHPAISTTSSKLESNKDTSVCHRYIRNLENKIVKNVHNNEVKDNSSDKKKSHIKKPLNAFMLYMKEMRAKVVAECTLKESAAINQILGRRWHELSREDQSKYYEKARQERQLHMELYPGWSARDNYGYVSKKKKRKKDRSPADSSGNSMKKCRARFGLDQQNQWCKPCKRKKKCIRYMESLGANNVKEEGYNDIDDMDGQRSDEDDIEHDTVGSCDSGDENTKNYEDDNESLNHSLSSPSGFSSFQSPTTSLASPVIAQEQNIHHQQVHTLQAQHLNQHLQQQHLPHFSQTIPISSSCSTSGSIYDTETITTITNSSSVISNILSSLTTSPSPTSSSGAFSGYATSSCSTNTSSANLPASLSDRMMRSLLSSSPAVLLGNRLSHLAMGLAMNNTSTNSIIGSSPPLNNNSISNEKPFNSLNLLGTGKNDTTATTTTTTFTTTPSLQAANVNIFTRPGDTDKIINSPINEISSSISRLISSPVSAITDMCKNSIQRSPIGANPRDINNPLSIDQLTKRTNEECSGVNSAEMNNYVMSTKDAKLSTSDVCCVVPGNTVFSRSNPTQQASQPTLQLPIQSHSAIYDNSFSQHFQQHFNQNLAPSTNSSTSSSLSLPPIINETMIKNNSIKSDNSNVRRRSSCETTTSESCAINVT